MRGLSAVALSIVAMVVLAAPSASKVDSGTRSKTYLYSVQVTGTISGFSAFNHSVVEGTASETVTWTATYPTFRLRVTPTNRLGRTPPGYSLSGAGRGSSDVTVDYARHGPYENCDWHVEYQRPMKMTMLGYPFGRAYNLKFGDFAASDQVEPRGCDAGDLGTNVPLRKAGLEGGRAASDRGDWELARLFLKAQPRKHLSYPLGALSTGKNLALRLAGTTADAGDTGSMTLAVTFKRR